MHSVEAGLSFTSLPARNPDQKSSPQLLKGIQQGLSLGLRYFLALLHRDPDLARSLEEPYLLVQILAILALLDLLYQGTIFCYIWWTRRREESAML